jgi:hypothetical protein
MNLLFGNKGVLNAMFNDFVSHGTCFMFNKAIVKGTSHSLCYILRIKKSDVCTDPAT